MRRRRRKRASELTSLIDVLFILLFASLVQARDSMERGDQPADTLVVDAGPPDAGPDAAPDAGPPDAGPADARPPDAAPGPGDGGARPGTNTHRERSRRLSSLMASAVQGVDAFVVEVAATGHVVEMARWREGARVDRRPVQHSLMDVPPGHSSENPVYLGTTRPWQRLCSLVLASLPQPQPDLAGAVVLVIADVPLGDLPLWLRDGLLDDATRCRRDAGGIAIVLDPANSIPQGNFDGIE